MLRCFTLLALVLGFSGIPTLALTINLGSLSPSSFTLTPGDTSQHSFSFSVSVSGGTGPFTYEWAMEDQVTSLQWDGAGSWVASAWLPLTYAGQQQGSFFTTLQAGTVTAHFTAPEATSAFWDGSKNLTLRVRVYDSGAGSYFTTTHATTLQLNLSGALSPSLTNQPGQASTVTVNLAWFPQQGAQRYTFKAYPRGFFTMADWVQVREIPVHQVTGTSLTHTLGFAHYPYELYMDTKAADGSYTLPRMVGEVTYVPPPPTGPNEVDLGTPSAFPLNIDPSSVTQPSFSFGAEIVNSSGTPELEWAVQDRLTGKYWHGSDWLSGAVWTDITGVWQDYGALSVRYQSNQVTVNVVDRGRTNAFFDRDKYLMLHFAVRTDDGVRHLAQGKLYLDLVFSPLLPPGLVNNPDTVNRITNTLTWYPHLDAELTCLALYPAGSFTTADWALKENDPAYHFTGSTTDVTLAQANQNYEIYMANKVDGVFSEPLMAGTINYSPPSFSHGAASPASHTVDFIATTAQTFTVQYTSSASDYDPNEVVFALRDNSGGTPKYFSGTAWVGTPIWHSSGGPLNAVRSVGSISFDLPPAIYPDLFTGPSGSNQSFAVVMQAGYYGDVVDFGDPPAVITLTPGPAPAAPTLLASHGTAAGTTVALRDVFASFRWDAVPGATRYTAELTDSLGQIVASLGNICSGATDGTVLTVAANGPPCAMIPLTWSGSYSLSVTAHNPGGASPAATWPVQVNPAPALTFNGTTVFEVVEGLNCVATHDFAIDVANLPDAAMGNNIQVTLKKGYDQTTWNGSGWSSGTHSFSLDSPGETGFMEGLDLDFSDPANPVIVANWDAALFTANFWQRTSTDPVLHGEKLDVDLILAYHSTSGNDTYITPLATYALDFTRGQVQDALPPTGQTCYFPDVTPTITWTAPPQTPSGYRVHIRTPNQTHLDPPIHEGETPVAAYTVPAGVLTEGARFDVYVTTLYGGCAGPAQQFYDETAVLTWSPQKSAVLVPPPPVDGNPDFLWHYVKDDASGQVFLENPRFEVVVDPGPDGLGADTPCFNDLAYAIQMEILYRDPADGIFKTFSAVYHDTTRLTVEDEEGNPLPQAEWVPQSNFLYRMDNSQLSDLYDRIRLTLDGETWSADPGLCAGDPCSQSACGGPGCDTDDPANPCRIEACRFGEVEAFVRIGYIRRGDPLVDMFQTFAKSNKIRFSFKRVDELPGNKLESLTLGEPEPATVHIETEDIDNTTQPKPVVWKIPFSYTLTQPEDPFVFQPKRWRWLWEHATISPTHWDGTQWAISGTTQQKLVKFGDYPGMVPPPAFFNETTLALDEANGAGEIFTAIQAPDYRSFFDNNSAPGFQNEDLNEVKIEVDVSLAYLGKDESLTDAVFSLPVRLTFLRGFDNLVAITLNPGAVTTPELDVAEGVNAVLELPIAYQLENAEAPLFIADDQLTLQWMNDSGSATHGGWFWTGLAWTVQPFSIRLDGQAPFKAANPFFRNLRLVHKAGEPGADQRPTHLHLEFAGAEVPGTFWLNQIQRPVDFRLIYREGTAKEKRSNNAAVRMDKHYVAPDWNRPTTFLLGLAETRDGYAPEPFFLHVPGNVTVAQHSTWMLGNEGISPDRSLFTHGAALASDEHAWLRIDHPASQAFDILALVIPFAPDHLSNKPHLDYANRGAVAITAPDLVFQDWVQQGNLFYRYFPNPNLDPQTSQPLPDRLAIAVFVPSDRLTLPAPTQVDGLTQSPGETTDLANPAQVSALLASTDPNHNRILTITHRYDETAAVSDRRLYTVAFSDQLGRPRESRAMPSHWPDGWDPKQVLISDLVKLDALGRVINAAKGHYSSIGVSGLATVTKNRDQAFTAAESFWASDQKENQRTYAIKDTAPYTRTIYENDSRGRVLAEMNLGSDFHQTNQLRYRRYHYFHIPAPAVSGLLNPGSSFHNLPTFVAGGDPVGGLMGTLAVDPNGSVVASFTGNDPEAVVLTVTNPTQALMAFWGLKVKVGEAPTAITDSQTVYLPGSYAERLAKNRPANADPSDPRYGTHNTTVFHHLDAYGRVLATYPPKALQFIDEDPDMGKLTVVRPQLAILNRYDAFDRVVEVQEPDAGISRFRYNLIGQLRFSQDANQRADAHWTETGYDDLGRVLFTRTVVIPGESRPEDLVPSQAQIKKAISSYEEIADSRLSTFYDFHPSENPIPGFASLWPSTADLVATYPWDLPSGGKVRFGPAMGLVTQTQGPQSAERFYYDPLGRPICKVYLYRDLAEPRILWQRFDSNDNLTGSYDHATGSLQRYQYDAWDRLLAIVDENPNPERMHLTVVYSFDDGAQPAEDGFTSGPFFRIDGLKDSLYLARFGHTPTGHVARVRYGGFVSPGNDDPFAFETRYTYDIRDWLQTAETQSAGADPIFKADLGYYTNVPAGYELYDGNIAQIVETYGTQLGAGEPRILTRKYQYDAGYQLVDAITDWGAEGGWPQTRQSYAYDRNGNRIEEVRFNVPQPAGTPGSGTQILAHTIANNSNRLHLVEKGPTDTTLENYLAMEGDAAYDAAGNLTQRVKIDDEGNTLTTTFTYADPVHPILPTRIVQTAVDPQGAPLHERRLVYDFAYDHNGARIMRHLQTFDNLGSPQLPEITWFQPMGTENLAELDASGRPSRAYLFAGDERIGFRDYGQTALYVKDHLGSTKMTLALDDPDISAATQVQNSATTGTRALKLDPQAGDSLVTFNAQAIVEDTPGNYVYSQTGMKLITTGEYLPVDTTATYELSGMLKTVTATQSKAYLALIPYDRDKNYIHPQKVVRYGAAVTVDGTVTATQVPVAAGSDFTGWQASTAMAYRRSIGIYYDGDTTKLPDYVHRYTPTNSSTDPSHGAYSQASGTSIILNTALPTEVLNQIQSGVTTVMNHASGDSYIYTAANDQWVPNTWTQYRGSLSGEQWGVGTDHFRKGTAFVQVAVLADWTNSGATLVIDEIHFTKVSDTYVTNSNPIGSDPAQIVSKPWTERILLAASDIGPYGIQFREIHNTPGIESHLYTGQEREPDLGLYYMGGRWMHPDIGRFDQVDPAREFWNSYAYVGNNPISFNDPTGEDAEVFIDDENKTILVKATIYVYGPGANQETLDLWRANFNEAWGEDFSYLHPSTGTEYKLNFEVDFIIDQTLFQTHDNILGQSFYGFYNEFNYIYAPRVVSSEHIRNNYIGAVQPSLRKYSELLSDNEKPSNFGHEFGHLLGLRDRYTGDNNSSFDRTIPGWEGSIMAGNDTRRNTVNQNTISSIGKEIFRIRERNLSQAGRVGMLLPSTIRHLKSRVVLRPRGYID